jgi:hypothetical protein
MKIAIQQTLFPDEEDEPMADFRIHGDNILECERALFLIADSFSATAHLAPSPTYMPRYEVKHDASLLFTR